MRSRTLTTSRAAVAVALLSAWLVLLFLGWIGAGAVHLLLAAALVAFPWRAAVSSHADPATNPDEEETS